MSISQRSLSGKHHLTLSSQIEEAIALLGLTRAGAYKVVASVQHTRLVDGSMELIWSFASFVRGLVNVAMALLESGVSIVVRFL